MEQPQARYKWKITQPWDESFEIMPMLTNDVQLQIAHLRATYTGAKIETWEIDDNGHIIQSIAEAGKEAEAAAKRLEAQRNEPKQAQEGKKRPSGMGQLFSE